jgi:hypothetical protein
MRSFFWPVRPLRWLSILICLAALFVVVPVASWLVETAIILSVVVFGSWSMIVDQRGIAERAIRDMSEELCERARQRAGEEVLGVFHAITQSLPRQDGADSLCRIAGTDVDRQPTFGTSALPVPDPSERASSTMRQWTLTERG